MSNVRSSTHGAVRVLILDRPHRRNAMTQGTAEQLAELIAATQRDETIGAIVLTGAGGHFSAGGDIKAIENAASADSDEPRLAMLRAFHRLVETVWETELPVVAAVSGAAYGGAFNLVLACDLIVCSVDARFCQVFLRRGLAPDVGGAYFLPRVVGMQRAKELMLRTSEVSADRATQMGFVNEVLPDAATTYKRAIELAAELAAAPRFAVSLTKKLLNAGTSGTLHNSLELEAFVQTTALRSDDARAGLANPVRNPGAEQPAPPDIRE
ncbi:enoyl-CoA hydratase/isomerase family protein [Sciscionella marina]|uniref:enoyl-CoA hydratase/isomerase family protein n=1 Tax=Sciscionella marina TaxID=508770 RepID=UPI00035E989E|nr:enoyl-CoA hydratase/isomerase family protein [Sciscionella marina]